MFLKPGWRVKTFLKTWLLRRIDWIVNHFNDAPPQVVINLWRLPALPGDEWEIKLLRWVDGIVNESLEWQTPREAWVDDYSAYHGRGNVSSFNQAGM